MNALPEEFFGRGAFVLAAVVPGFILVVYGLLMFASLGLRSAEFARRYGRRIRLQRPWRVLAEGAEDEDLSYDEALSTIAKQRSELQERQETNERLAQNVEEWRRETHHWKGLSRRLQTALDIALTWLYRRQNWSTLSPDGRTVEGAPEDIWAKPKYDELGLSDVTYTQPPRVGVEPGWTPPDTTSGVLVQPGLAGSAGPAYEQVGEVAGDRPPKCVDLDEKGWEAQRPGFWSRLQDAISRGQAIYEMLVAVAPSATPLDESKFKPAMQLFSEKLDSFVRDYYGETPPYPAGDEFPLGPTWRQGRVQTVTSRLAWLRAEAKRTNLPD